MASQSAAVPSNSTAPAAAGGSVPQPAQQGQPSGGAAPPSSAWWPPRPAALWRVWHARAVPPPSEEEGESCDVEPGAQERQLRAVFEDIDQNHNGQLEPQELQAALRQLGLPASSAYLADLLKQYDRDNNRAISWREFRAYAAAKECVMQHAFSRLDIDSSGAITPGELVAALKKSGLPVTEEDAVKMIRLLDKDHNNEISFEEYRRFLCLLPEAQLANSNELYAWLDSADWVEGVEYRLCMTPPKQPMQRFLAGGLAGAVSRSAVAPLERLRTMMMADPRNSSLAPTLRKMFADGGVLGMFRGNLATVVKVVPQSAIQFAVFDQMQDLFVAYYNQGEKRELNNWQRLAAGSVAGASATLVTYPLETLRTHISLAGSSSGAGSGAGARGASYLGTARGIVAGAGLRGLYQGFQPGMINNVVSNALGFTAYEVGLSLFREAQAGRPATPGERGVLGGAAAVVVMTVTMPLEVIMRRLQIQGSPGYPVRYAGPLSCVRRIAAEEGVAAFWRGSLSSYMKVVPSIAAVRFLYEALVQWWGVGGIRQYRNMES